VPAAAVLLLLHSLALWQNVLDRAMASEAAHTTAAQRLELLRPLCGDNAQDDGCVVCPPGTDFPRDKLQLTSVFYGHLRSPKSDDAAVAFRGCEAHVHMFGGTFLLTRERGEWTKADFREGWIGNGPCRKMRSGDGRDVLICADANGHPDSDDEFVSLMDFNSKSEDGSLNIFFGLDDSGCFRPSNLPPGMVVSGSIVKVSIAPPEIVIEARLGKGHLTDEQMANCNLRIGRGSELLLLNWVRPVLRTYRFRFNGAEVVPEPGNPPMNEYHWAIPPQ
jgi:hypothetical protein